MTLITLMIHLALFYNVRCATYSIFNSVLIDCVQTLLLHESKKEI